MSKTNLFNNYRLLKVVLEEDNMFSAEVGAEPTINHKLLGEHKYLLKKYINLLRYDEFLSNSGSIFLLPIRIIVKLFRNRLGTYLGILIPNNTCEAGLIIWHYGSVIVNGHAKIGKNCQFHGDNCVGNKGTFNQAAPEIGNNVDIGIGAKVIGEIYIADGIKIGANAVVTKSFYEKGITIAGIPARKISKET